MLKVWGRNTSSNVQKVMWAIGEIGLRVDRIDVGGSFGKTREPPYIGMNPNGLVPTLEEEDGYTLWESNSIVRYLAVKYHSSLEPADLKVRMQAQKWMDWQLSVMGPAILPVFLGLVRTPPEKRDPKSIEKGKAMTGEATRILDSQLANTAFLAGDAFSYGDIPSAIMVRRYRDLVPDRPAFNNVERWFAAIAARPAFQQHVLAIPLV